MKKTLSSAFIVAALALTSACGGGDGGGDKPSKSELSKQLVESAGVTKKQADCAADAILDSDLSNDGLQALAEGDTEYKPSAEDKKVQTEITSKITKCIAG